VVYLLVGVLIGAEAVRRSQDSSEERLQAGKVSSDDTDVAFNDRPYGDVPGVPQPVALFAVVWEVADFDEGGNSGAWDCQMGYS
jgi:hypothetical protein